MSQQAADREAASSWEARAAEPAPAARPSRRRDTGREGAPRPQRRPEAARPAANRQAASFSARDKFAMVTTLIIVGIIFAALVSVSMYKATIQKDINITNAKSASLQEDIENLQLAIEKKKDISLIESEARKLGMVYPNADKGEIVYLDDVKKAQDKAASAKAKEGN